MCFTLAVKTLTYLRAVLPHQVLVTSMATIAAPLKCITQSSSSLDHLCKTVDGHYLLLKTFAFLSPKNLVIYINNYLNNIKSKISAKFIWTLER